MATQLELQVLALTQALQDLIDQSLTVHQLQLNNQPSMNDEVGVWSSVQNKIMKLPLSIIAAMVSGSNVIQNSYPDIDALLANQSDQTYGLLQLVEDSADDVDSGSIVAIYVSLGLNDGLLSDYVRITDAKNEEATWETMQGDPKSVNLMEFTDGVGESYKIDNIIVPLNKWKSVAYGEGKFVAVANDLTNRVMTSTDGLIWSSTSFGLESTDTWECVAYGNGKFLALGGTYNKMISSTNGTFWSTVTLPVGSQQFLFVAYLNGVFIALALTGTSRILTSTNGTSWTQRTAPELNGWRCCAYGNGVYVALSYNGTNRVMISYDSITWVLGGAIEENAWSDIAFGNGIFVATAINGINRIATSVDGIEWNSIAAPQQNSWKNIIFAEGMFVATSYNGIDRIMTSFNGVDWELENFLEDKSYVDIAYGNGKFVAVSLDGDKKVSTFSKINEIKFENIVNEYQTSDGTPIPIVNKVLRLPPNEGQAYDEATVLELEEGTDVEPKVASPKVLNDWINAAVVEETGTTLQLNNTVKGKIYNKTSPSTDDIFTVTDLKSGGFATNYIDTTGKTEFPEIDDTSINCTITKSDIFREDAIFKMIVETDGTNVEYFFLDYLATTAPEVGGVLVKDVTGDGTGIIIAERDEANYGITGSKAIDLSTSDATSTIRGATGVSSIALQDNSRASGLRSIAGGLGSWARDAFGISIGNETYSKKPGSISLGDGSEAWGAWSLAVGVGLIARSYAETVVGLWNISASGNEDARADDNKAFSVGVGVSDLVRRDGFVVTKRGAVSAPMLDDFIIDYTGDKSLINKEYFDSYVNKVYATLRENVAYTLAENLRKYIHRYNNPAVVITIDENSLSSIGSKHTIDYIGTGTLEIAAGGTAVLLCNANKKLFANGQYSMITVLKVSETDYRVYGDLEDL